MPYFRHVGNSALAFGAFGICIQHFISVVQILSNFLSTKRVESMDDQNILPSGEISIFLSFIVSGFCKQYFAPIPKHSTALLSY